VVIGAGAIGLAIARRLAQDGWSVVVLDAAPGAGLASRAAAGMLAPSAEAEVPDAFFELALASRRLFPSFAKELEEESGMSLDYREDGLLAFPVDDLDETELARRAEWQRAAGLEIEELDSGDLARRWPRLELPVYRPDPRGGRIFHFPGEAQVDSGLIVDALLTGCAHAGVDVKLGTAARGLRLEEGRVVSVETEEGELGCDVVVNAAGAWAGHVAEWAGEGLPLEPVRGEMLAYATHQTPPRPIVVAAGAYCLVRTSGHLLVGATVERAGYDAITTGEGQAWLEAHAAELVPSLAAARPSLRWAGLRPATPDHLPVLGFSAEVRGLYHATGHYRNGILLAPVSAEIARSEVAGDLSWHEVSLHFGPTRFGSRAEATG
jgi:glycine oxidase